MRDFDEDSYMIGDLKQGTVLTNNSHIKNSYRAEDSSTIIEIDL